MNPLISLFGHGLGELQKPIVVIISLLLAYLGLGFSFFFNGFFPPYLQTIIGFTIVLIIPGYLLCTILSIDFNQPIVNVIVILGISYTFATLSGLILSIIGEKTNFIAISFNSLLLYYSICIGFLLILIILKGSKTPIIFNKDILFDKLTLSLILIVPTSSIVCSIILNIFNIPYFSIIFFICLSFLPFFYNYKKYHVVLIWITAFSILISYHLVSNYLWGWDIHNQFYFANLVKQSGFWDPHIPNNLNSLLSIVIAAPIFSILMNLDLVWIFKIIFPFILSSIPVLVYLISKNQFKDEKIAFFSAFIYIFFYGFFKDMVDKQFVALFFLLLFIFIISQECNFQTKLIAFLSSMMIILSHYGVSWILLFSLTFLCVIIGFLKKFFNSNFDSRPWPLAFITTIFLLILIYWELVVSQGMTFNNIVYAGNIISDHIFEIFQPDARSGILYLQSGSNSTVWLAYKFFNLLLVIFIAVGIIFLIFSLLKRKIIIKGIPYGVIAVCFFLFLVTQTILTFGLGMDRILQIVLPILSPFAVIGFIKIFEFFPINVINQKIMKNQSLKLFAIFLCLLFLFNAGIIHELTGNPLAYSIAINKNPTWHLYSPDEIFALRFLKSTDNNIQIAIFNPWFGIKSREGTLLKGGMPDDRILRITSSTQTLSNVYIFEGNNIKIEIPELDPKLISPLISKTNKIFLSGNASVFYASP